MDFSTPCKSGWWIYIYWIGAPHPVTVASFFFHEIFRIGNSNLNLHLWRLHPGCGVDPLYIHLPEVSYGPQIPMNLMDGRIQNSWDPIMVSRKPPISKHRTPGIRFCIVRTDGTYYQKGEALFSPIPNHFFSIFKLWQPKKPFGIPFLTCGNQILDWANNPPA